MINKPAYQFLLDLFNSLKNPIVFTNNDHVIEYMNQAAIEHYKEGTQLLGTSVLDCHNEESQKQILEIHQQMKEDGLTEKLITDNSKHRIYMRSVRDDSGNLIGYYERYEPPVKKQH
jgi:nitrogen-specific signal transduction histidine kinase